MTTAAEVELATAQERLRQERETFDQAKKHDARWFQVRLAMGWAAALALPVILGIAAYIIFRHDEFSETTVAMAATALLVDALGTLFSLYKLVLGELPKRELAPVTQTR